MAQTAILKSHHSDLITSLSFNLHGTRLASSSLDHSIRVTTISPLDGGLSSNDSSPPSVSEILKAHDAPVLKVAWAHPEFGTLLASGGVDGMVKIWVEEPSSLSSSASNTITKSSAAAPGSPALGVGVPSNTSQNDSHTSTSASHSTVPPRKWTQKGSLSDARGTIRDLEFSPPEFGLKLAAVSSDAHLRLWECLDPGALFGPSSGGMDWTLIEDIDLSALGLGTSTATTNSGMSPAVDSGVMEVASTATRLLPGSTMGVATDSFDSAGGSTGGIGIAGGNIGAVSPSKFGSTGSNVPGTSLAASSSTGGSSAGDLISSRKQGTVESDGGWSLSWCKEAWWGERLAVSCGTNGVIRLFHLPDHAPWHNYLNLLPPRSSSSGSVSPTSSLAWAPASGRSYQLLASGARDGRARVWKIYTPSLDLEEPQSFPSKKKGPNALPDQIGERAAGEWRGEVDAELEEASSSRGGAVGAVKVEWNVTGTVLSTAGDDAKIRLWKSTYTGQWRPIAILSTEESASGGKGMETGA